jgi:hypothetical protein
MYFLTNRIVEITVFSILIFGFFFFTFTKIADASTSYGYFEPKISYVNSTTTVNAGCAQDQSSVEFWLVEKDTEDLITGSVDSWSVNLRSSASNTVKIGGQVMTTGQKKTQPICFDPLINGFQIIVDSSTDYKTIITPSIFPGSTDLATLQSMQGNHFKGYVQLDKISATIPLVEAVTPNQNSYTTVPNFSVKTNYLPNIYGVNALNLIKLYVVNQVDNSLYVKSITTSGGTGTRSVSGPSSLPEGFYYWTFHQEFNGQSTTQKLISPTREWTFSNIPTSGIPDALPFVIDKTNPISTLSVPKIISTDSTIKTVKVTLTNNTSDAYSGLSYTTLYIDNITTGAPITEYISTQNFSSNTSASSSVYVIDGLRYGNTYRFYTKTADNVGHIYTTPFTSFSVPQSFSVPIVKLYSATSSGIFSGVGDVYNSAISTYASTTDSHSNPLIITDRAMCWATSTTDLSSTTDIFTKTYCKKSDVNLANSNYFNYWTGSMPASTTVYFRMMAQNSVGWGFSNINSTTTKPNPFGDASSTPALPVVSYISPASTTPTSLDPSLKISSAGNLSIDQYGICYSTDPNDINMLDPAQLNNQAYLASWISHCKLYGPLSNTTALPFTVKNTNPYTFVNLSPNTDYYFKVFVINSFGVGYAYGAGKTSELYYDFRNFNSSTYGVSPRFVISTDDFDLVKEVYKKIKVEFAAFDNSYDCCSYSGTRNVDYKIDLDIGNNFSVDDTRTGTISLAKSSTTPSFSSVEFYNIPLGDIKVISYINEPVSPLYPQQQNSPYKQNSASVTLNNPNMVIDEVAGSDNSSSTELVLDPQLSITVLHPTIRVGQSTTLNWSMLNSPSPFTCNILGPSTFATGGLYSFTHTPIPGPATTVATGSLDTGILKNSQLFKFECVSTLDSSINFSTTTRVNTVGIAEEI